MATKSTSTSGLKAAATSALKSGWAGNPKDNPVTNYYKASTGKSAFGGGGNTTSDYRNFETDMRSGAGLNTGIDMTALNSLMTQAVDVSKLAQQKIQLPDPINPNLNLDTFTNSLAGLGRVEETATDDYADDPGIKALERVTQRLQDQPTALEAQNQMMEQAGVNQSLQQLKSMQLDIASRTKQYQEGMLKIQNQAIPNPIIGKQERLLQQQGAIEIGALTAAAEALKGNLELSLSIIDRQQRAYEVDLNNRQRQTEMIFGAIQNVIERKENQKFEIKKMAYQNYYAEQRDFSQMRSSAIKEALIAGDTKAATAMASYTDLTSLASSPYGRYLQTQEERLRLQNLGLQNQKLRQDLTPANTVNGTSNSIDQLKFLRDTVAEANSLAGAAGASGVSKWLGDMFKGDTNFRRLETKTDTLRTNVLTLMTDPNIKKFFGPQMSEADVRLMTSAGTTLRADGNSPADLKAELARLDNLFNRMQTAVQYGMQGAVTVTAPDGKQIIITN